MAQEAGLEIRELSRLTLDNKISTFGRLEIEYKMWTYKKNCSFFTEQRQIKKGCEKAHSLLVFISVKPLELSFSPSYQN